MRSGSCYRSVWSHRFIPASPTALELLRRKDEYWTELSEPSAEMVALNIHLYAPFPNMLRKKAMSIVDKSPFHSKCLPRLGIASRASIVDIATCVPGERGIWVFRQ